MSIGRVFGRAFAAIGAMPGAIIGIVALFGAVPAVGLAYVSQAAFGATAGRAAILPHLFGVLFLSVGVGTVLACVTQAMLTPAIVAHAREERSGFGATIAAALPALFPVIGVGIIVALGFSIGMILLLVPGIMIYIMWSVAPEAAVIERVGIIEALKRSQMLTSGARWKIFGLWLLVSIISWVVIGALTIIVGRHDSLVGVDTPAAFAGWAIVNFMQTLIITVCTHSIQASLYVELRDWKDGTPNDALAEVFA